MYGSSFAWGSNGDTTYAAVRPGVRYPVNLDTIQPVSGWWIYDIVDEVKGGNDHTATVGSVDSQSTQMSSLKRKNRRSSKDSKAKDGWLRKRLQSLVSSDA